MTEHNTNLNPTVNMKDKNDKRAILNAFPNLKSKINSPKNAPTKGAHIIPNGGKNNPTMIPIVEPTTANFDPPPILVTSIGAK